MSGDENDFWSRRRAAVEAEAKAEDDAIAGQAQLAEQAGLEEKSDEEILAELNLPDPDTLKHGDDFSAFMSKAVPDRLRRRALRKLWTSNSILANVDGLVDYGEDFTDSALVVENLQTAYQVGKGMLKHVLEMERQAEAELSEIDKKLVTEGEISVDMAQTQPASDENDAPIASVPNESLDVSFTDTEDEPVASVPRRMNFTFETDSA